MKKMIWRFFLCLSGLFALWGSAGAAQETPRQLQDLYARSAVLMDGRSGRILFGKNEREVLPMASTTKIMTCILALESGNLRELATASANAAAQPEVRLGVREGENYYLEDLLYALMLESFNDSAVMIAEHIAGSTEAFAARMNQKAQELGCSDTHFVTPNGLDAEDAGGAHSTTAADLARIMAYCVAESPAREEFLRITQTRSYSFTSADGTRSFSCQNHNAFLDMMEGALSGKTGFTSAAGYCYVGALQNNDRLFVVALLACGWPYNRTYKWSDTKALMTYGIENYENRQIKCGEAPGPIRAEGGLAKDKDPWKTAYVPLAIDASGGGGGTYLLRKDETITSRTTVRKSLTAPAPKGTVVGKVGYYLGEELLEEYPVVTAQSVEARYLEHWLGWVWDRFRL